MIKPSFFRIWILCGWLLLSTFTGLLGQETHSIARQWSDIMLTSIRNDFARPPVHARNLFHLSIGMYDAWAAYDAEAKPYLLGNITNGYVCPFEGVPMPEDIEAAREEAISYLAYNLILHRFSSSPAGGTALNASIHLMRTLGYDRDYISTDYQNGNPAALGNFIAEHLITYGLEDGSNEVNDYANQRYIPVNEPFNPRSFGNGEMTDPDRWQPMAFDLFVGQSGLSSSSTPEFIGPEWGWVSAFALTDADRTYISRDGVEWPVYHDPGDPAYLRGSDDEGEAFMWNFGLVAAWASHLDPADSVLWDISPASIGNVAELPADPADWRDFYDLENGGDPGQGHALNPHTGEPYPAQMVPRADYARVLAEFWADGPDSETPPGHWFVILNEINEHPALERRFEGEGPELSPLEWDVKCYLALGGAMHDAAISAWSIKGYYDYLRPISGIREMAGKGQSSFPSVENYDPEGLPIIPGFIEQIKRGDDLAGFNDNNVGRMKVRSWRGPDFIFDPDISVAGVGWILAEYWWPYQRPTFVSPPFAGYVSGHSTFSRAAAEVLTMMTGDPFFPGGVGEFPIKQDSFLVFERGPSVDMTLQWATYRDASDQTSLSRIWGGIHPPVDDIPGRLIGEQIGIAAFEQARKFFDGEVAQADLTDLPIAFPNPAERGENWTVYIPAGTLPGNLQLIDVVGRTYWRTDVSPGTLGSSLRIPTERLTPGIYVLVLHTEGGKQHIKLRLY